MLVIKYHPADREHWYERVVYMVLTPDRYYLTQYERATEDCVRRFLGALDPARPWLKAYHWEVPARDWETNEPFVYDFARNPHF